MIEEAVHKLMSESAQAALETMFFATPDSVSKDSQRPAGKLIAASLTFEGAPPGRFALLVSDSVARNLTQDFMGCDDAERLLPAQVAGMMGELCNMMCGAVLSDLEAHANFDLSAPQSIHVGAGEPGPDFAAGSSSVCRFEFPAGALVLFLEFEEPA
jgi:CheY-specific phosphatase CheX